MKHPEMPVRIQLNTLKHPKADDQTDENPFKLSEGDKLFFQQA